MALNDTQLDDVKTKLEAGTILRTILKDDYPAERGFAVRQQMIDKYGQAEFQNMMLSSRMADKTVEELNTMIAGIQGRLAWVTAIRDAKL
jgi:hypothetical protein